MPRRPAIRRQVRPIPSAGQAVDAATMLAQLTADRGQPAPPGAGDGGRPLLTSAIIAVVDRGGRVLGVRVENGVSSAITSNPNTLVFAVDGALAEARTGRHVRQRSGPADLADDPGPQPVDDHPARGPVEPEHHRSQLHDPGGRASSPRSASRPTSRRASRSRPRSTSSTSRGPTATASAIPTPTARPGRRRRRDLPSRFNVPVADIPANIVATGTELTPPESYGYISGLEPEAQARGIGTLPGGIPIIRMEKVGGVETARSSSAGSASSTRARPATRPRRTRRSTTPSTIRASPTSRSRPSSSPRRRSTAPRPRARSGASRSGSGRSTASRPSPASTSSRSGGSTSSA